jgi:uncharacterized membrane protein YdbT with pleckstrin-like domain
MVEQILFKSKISQAINLLSILVSTLVTLVILVFKKNIIEGIIDLLTSLNEVVPIQNFDAEKYGTIFLFIIIGIFWLRTMWKMLVTHNTIYEFTNDRILMEFGVLNKENDFLEYFRIKDYTVKRPLIARMLKLCDIYIISTDRTHPRLKLRYINNLLGKEVLLRNKIEESTASGRGRELDVV